MCCVARCCVVEKHVMLCFTYVTFSTSLPHLPLLFLCCHPHQPYTALHYITSSATTLSDVKKKNGSDDGSEDAPPSPQKPVKGASKQTWGAKSKGTVMSAFCYCCSILLLIFSCLVYLLFFSSLHYISHTSPIHP